MLKRSSLALLATLSCHVWADQPLPVDVASIAHRWAHIYYLTPEKDSESAFRQLADDADQLVKARPGQAEPMVWEAIVLASYAKVEGGLGALGKAKQAKDLLLSARKIDPNTLNGSIYTSLGSLYDKVPGWPIGFGDKKEARANFEKAIQVNPQGIDANFFYADFLARQGEFSKALEYVQKALVAPARPGREDADAGRHKEAEQLLLVIKNKIAG